MQSIDRTLAELARCCDGLVIEQDALAAGLTRRQLRTQRDRGVLRPLYPGVYAHQAVAPSGRQRLRAAVAASGGVLSHRTAAHLHGLLLQEPARPEVTIAPNRNFRPSDIVVYRHDRLDDIDVTVLDSFPVTTPVRTMADLGTRVSYATLCRAGERGLRLGLFTQEQLGSTRSRLARRGRNGVGPLRLLLGASNPDLAPTDSELELLLWEVVQRFDLPQPVRQLEVDIAGERYLIDVAYPHAMIAIEVDGFGVHSERRAFEKDRARQNALVLAGWLILRFTWAQLKHHPEHAARSIRRALTARGGPRPRP